MCCYYCSFLLELQKNIIDAVNNYILSNVKIFFSISVRKFVMLNYTEFSHVYT